ncbi:hypothetical protein DRP04_07850 [Archaeoglobales archaeon]|nr:MAG: hypothetical protein DRP04_07850 [Archaeoglobales archaeon]
MSLKNIGYKSVCLFVGLFLGILYVLFDVLTNWLTATNLISAAIHTMQGFAFLTLAIPLIGYIAHLIFVVIFKLEGVLRGEEEE